MILTDQERCYWDRVTGETLWRMEDGYKPRWLQPHSHYVHLGDD